MSSLDYWHGLFMANRWHIVCGNGVLALMFLPSQGDDTNCYRRLIKSLQTTRQMQTARFVQCWVIAVWIEARLKCVSLWCDERVSFSRNIVAVGIQMAGDMQIDLQNSIKHIFFRTFSIRLLGNGSTAADKFSRISSIGPIFKLTLATRTNDIVLHRLISFN